MHHSIIHIENPTRCHSVSKFYFIFIWSLTCFGRHTAHHQKPKSAQAPSDLHAWKVVGRVVAGRCQAEPDSVQQLLSFILIWNKILIHCGILLDFLYELYYGARIHRHQIKHSVVWNCLEEDRLTLRRLMSYIYGAPILDVSRSHTTTQHSR